MMAVLFWLIAGHFIADYPLQTDFVAQRKNRKNNLPSVPWYYVMAAHAFTHGAAVTLATGSPILGVAETVLHFLIDTAKCEGLTTIHVDQGMHLICKLLWLAIVFNTY